MDVRWHQRLQHFEKALSKLREAVLMSRARPLSDLERQGLIKAFEFTHELAWNTLKDYFTDQGNTSITGSRDATREAFQKGLIQHGDQWMDMIKSRNLSSHTYNEDTAIEVSQRITSNYLSLFDDLVTKLNELKDR
jgi:nucleotidyltransferase substrate binding protein (TIGR01987 family)